MRLFIELPWNREGAPTRAYIHTRRWVYMVGAPSERSDKLRTFAYVTRHAQKPGVYDHLQRDPWWRVWI